MGTITDTINSILPPAQGGSLSLPEVATRCRRKPEAVKAMIDDGLKQNPDGTVTQTELADYITRRESSTVRMATLSGMRRLLIALGCPPAKAANVRRADEVSVWIAERKIAWRPGGADGASHTFRFDTCGNMGLHSRSRPYKGAD